MEPPKDLPTLHRHVSIVCRRELAKVRQYEKTFYGADSTRESSLKKWSLSFNSMRTFFQQTSEIHSLVQVEKMLQILENPASKAPFPVETVKMMKDLDKQIKMLIKDDLNRVFNELNLVFEMMKKYCLSFYSQKTLSPDVASSAAPLPSTKKELYLVLPADYDRKRKDFVQNLQKTFRQAEFLRERIVDPGLGVTMSDLSNETRVFAHRVDAEKIPFILVFHESCLLVEMVTRILEKWTLTDHDYVVHLVDEVKKLAEYHKEHTKKVKTNTNRLQQLLYRKKQAEVVVVEAEKDVENLEPAQFEAGVQKEIARRVCRDSEYLLEKRRFERTSIHKQLQKESFPAKSTEQLYILNSDIHDIKWNLPQHERKLRNAQRTLQWIDTKKQRLAKNKAVLDSIKKEIREIAESLVHDQEEYEKMKKCLEKLREISLCKNSSDTLLKIYLKRPVARSEQERFEELLYTAVAVVSINIGKDWMTLYRALPFFPPRGTDIIERDILETEDIFAYGGDAKDIALHLLIKWCRMHTRVLITDLVVALESIRRHDIAIELEELNHKPEYEDEEEIIVQEIPEAERLHQLVTSLCLKLESGEYSAENLLQKFKRK